MSDIQTIAIAHSPLGASGSGRWMHCPGSIQLAKRLNIHGSKSGFAAKEGTAAHEVLARCVENYPDNHEPWEFMGTKVIVEGDEFEVDQRMVDALNLCFNHMMDDIKQAEGEGEIMLFTEVSMKHSKHELMYGTTDCGVVSLRRDARKVRIRINDLKYGAGVTVEPTSSQIKYYAELIVDRLIQDKVIDSHDDVEEIILTIMQPRIPHPDGLIRSISMTGPELEAWYLDELVPAMEETENPDAILAMGEWCTFCPVKDHCTAMSQAIIELSTAVPPEGMTVDELGEAIEKIKAIAKLGERYEKVLFERMMAGEKSKKWKLVKKKANRAWRKMARIEDPNEPDGFKEVSVESLMVAKFGADAYTMNLLSPPQLEKLPDGKVFVAQYAFMPQDTGLTVAPSSDKRPEARSLMDMAEESDRDMSDLEI